MDRRLLGYRDATQVLVFLEDAAESPLLNAKREVQKKLQKLVASAKAAAVKNAWDQVAKDVRAAAAMPGRCAERDELKALGKQADDWVNERLAAVIAAAQGDGDLSEARKRLQDVQKVFSGQPEAKLAATGIEALVRIGFVRKVEARGNAKAALIYYFRVSSRRATIRCMRSGSRRSKPVGALRPLLLVAAATTQPLVAAAGSAERRGGASSRARRGRRCSTSRQPSLPPTASDRGPHGAHRPRVSSPRTIQHESWGCMPMCG